jgi:mevalonate kinase
VGYFHHWGFLFSELMPAISASAPGKIILFGEHAAVYGRPAIAAPVTQVQARAMILANPAGAPGEVMIDAPDIGFHSHLTDLPNDHPLAIPLLAVQEQLKLDHLPAFRMRITSTIPVAAGLGSGAAVSVAVVRAVSTFLGHPLDDEQVSAIAFQVDQKYHGTPSGIDNTVITYASPVFFVRGQPFERLRVKNAFTLVIANTGIRSSTGEVVGDVRRRWQAEPERYERLFDRAEEIARRAREIILGGNSGDLGPWMSANHALLQELDVSSPELDHLVEAAMAAGALGAKLCGGGRGGNMIALAGPVSRNAENLASALRAAGAVTTIITTVA